MIGEWLLTNNQWAVALKEMKEVSADVCVVTFVSQVCALLIRPNTYTCTDTALLITRSLQVYPSASEAQQHRMVSKDLASHELCVVYKNARDVYNTQPSSRTCVVFPRELAKNQSSKQVEMVDLHSAFMEPLCYPLLFPQGTLGFGFDDNYRPTVGGTYLRAASKRYC